MGAAAIASAKTLMHLRARAHTQNTLQTHSHSHITDTLTLNTHTGTDATLVHTPHMHTCGVHARHTHVHLSQPVEQSKPGASVAAHFGPLSFHNETFNGSGEQSCPRCMGTMALHAEVKFHSSQ